MPSEDILIWDWIKSHPYEFKKLLEEHLTSHQELIPVFEEFVASMK